MFTGFFYLLRAHGFRVSLNEWMTLIEGLMLDLQHDSLTGFYELCRAVLVKSEADYDKFDQIFLEYFDGVPYQNELPKELMDWLNNPAAAMKEFRKFLRTQGYEEKSIEEILKNVRRAPQGADRGAQRRLVLDRYERLLKLRQ